MTDTERSPRRTGEQKTMFVADLADPRARGAALRVAMRAAPSRETARTSDVTRVRRLAVAGILAAAGALGAFVASPTALHAKAEGPGPLTLAHQKAALTCAKCHGKAEPGTKEYVTKAKGACVGCHEAHPSTREGHRKLAKAGELGCTTCHAPHGPHQGVRFGADGSATRYGQGGEVAVDGVSFRAHRKVLVPMIPVKACLGCHQKDPRDPLAQCISDASAGDRAVSLCFDEHQDALPADATDVAGPKSKPTTLSTKSVCAEQHFPDRAHAWEAARVSVAKVPWVGAPRSQTTSFGWIGIGAGAGALGYVATGLVGWARRRKKKKEIVPVQAAERKRLPVIDTNTCLGCYACVDACPYGVLEVEKYVAVVARPDACCGLVLCEQKCPNGSLKMFEGEILGDRPRVAESLESLDVPGLYLAGDVTGLPLIKNAILQGAHAADEAIANVRAQGKPDDEVFDLCVVGAGPSGISAALRAKEKGAEFIVLEQGNVAESIRSFPRGKLIFDQPLDIPVAGKLWLKESSKEELLLHWMRIVRREELPIREGRRMTSVKRLANGSFEVRATTIEGGEEVVHARAVILSIGKRGTPRKLGCDVPTEAESRVYYHLADARSLAGQRIVVAGLGDTAMEAAIAICQQPDPTNASANPPPVTIVARAATYSRGQSRNIQEVERLRKTGRIEILWESEISSVGPRPDGALELAVSGKGGSRRLQADAVLVLIGSIAPWDTLARAGVRRVEREGDAPGEEVEGQ